MSSINVSRETKREFDDLKPEDDTQDEFVAELLDMYQTDVIDLYQLQVEEGLINPEEVAQEIKERIATEVEVAAVRGVQEGIETYSE